MRVRNLKVWFSQRGGLLKEMVTRGTRWVRAVDGVDLDVRRGEVFCLVGESGCGKTTTGKAILRLVDTTEGDIFLEMPEEDYARYEQAAHAPPEDAAAKEAARELRRKYSLTWKEQRPWTWKEYLLSGVMMAAAFVLCGVGLAALLGLLTDPFADVAQVYVFSISLAVVMGVVGSLPPARPSRRTAMVLALLSFFAWILAPIPAFYAHGSGLSPADAIGTAWGGNFFFFILAGILVPIITGAAAQGVVATRLKTAEYTGLNIRGLRKRLQLIFQDPYESLNPKQSVYEIVAEPLRVNKRTKTPEEAGARTRSILRLRRRTKQTTKSPSPRAKRITTSPEEIAAIVSQALNDVGLRPPEEFMFRFPHELSGGQRQRVSIAAGLVLQPDFIVADEPVSMLDVSIRTEILQLMMDLRTKRSLTYLFITHDLGLAWILADRIAVMYLGKIVEQGTADDVVAHPKHPYTQALISVVPSPDPRHKAVRQILRGERPDPVDIPTGCRFHPRCPMAFEPCGWNAAELAEEFAETEREIAQRIGATVQERKAQLEALRKEASEPGAQAANGEPQRLESQIEDLDAGRRNAEALAAAFQAKDPHTLLVAVPAGRDAKELADALRALVAAQKNTRVGFRAVREITEAGNTVSIALHEWVEPVLIEVAPGNSVSCHLMTARTPTTQPAETVRA